MRRIEQPADDFGVRLRRVVAEKVGDFVGRRRKPGHVERDSPQQRQLVGLGGRIQPVGFQLMQYKAVDRRFGPPYALTAG